MNVLHVASEVAPLAKTGGLADVCSALPKALTEHGVRVTLVAPRYAFIDPDRFSLARRLRTLGDCTIYEGHLPGSNVGLYLVEHPPSFGRSGIYGEAGKDYPDNAQRYALLCRTALEICRTFTTWPDVVHAHDWQTALVCFMLARGWLPGAPRTPTVLTIHNLAFLGLAPKTVVDELGLGWDAYNPEGFEFFDQVSLLKAGIVWATHITTVSPRYAREILTPELGVGLDGFLQKHAHKLTGILNGVDYHVWNPKHYSAADLSGKQRCKHDLQRHFGLPARGEVLLLGSISRLTEQKGFDLVTALADQLGALDIQYVVLGSGDHALEAKLKQMAARWPSKFAVKIAYDDALAHRIEEGADAFLMPSRYEPCGLNQMYSLRHGTLPIVRATGGLDDTVVDIDAQSHTGTGFKFEEYTPGGLLGAILRAMRLWQNRSAWREAVLRAMRQDFSWHESARQYALLYEQVRRRNHP
jgi:starch synthase